MKARSACIAPTERLVEDYPWLGVASATAHQVAAPPGRRMAINRFVEPSDLWTLDALSPYVADGVSSPPIVSGAAERVQDPRHGPLRSVDLDRPDAARRRDRPLVFYVQEQAAGVNEYGLNPKFARTRGGSGIAARPGIELGGRAVRR